jgi:hypothetical protein
LGTDAVGDGFAEFIGVGDGEDAIELDGAQRLGIFSAFAFVPVDAIKRSFDEGESVFVGLAFEPGEDFFFRSERFPFAFVGVAVFGDPLRWSATETEL